MKSFKPWDADAADKPGSSSSLDLLLRWLQAPGNYHRWETETRSPLTKEIANELKQQGITSRSPLAVRHKITKLEQQYEDASNWLEKEGHLEQYHRGEAEEAVHLGVLQRCPLYLELTPVFQSTGHQNEGSDENMQDADEGEDSQEEDAVGVEQELKLVGLPNVGEKRSTDMLDTQSSLTKRAKCGAALADAQGHGAAAEQMNAAVNYQHFAEFHKGSESRWNEYFGVEFVSHSEEAEEKMTEKLLQRRIEHLDAFAKVKLDAEQKRQEMTSRCTEALARQKLRRGGLSEEEVDEIIPK